ncbi:hypothetical protein [Labrenzia sp. CP4]|jgi:hypothetical protein|uniref:hypothetical protein n=1 Tax=Labrenzia sp. CP4 TaxID=1674922 RepID=UPI00119D9969|nr:hypothetical protein [Labrenzia sp. CP4]
MVKLVVENDPKEIARRQILDHLERELRLLFANLLRVSRGAGKAYEVGANCAAVVSVYQQYREVEGCYPASHEVSRALDFRKDMDQPFDEMRFGIERIVAGSFQLVASEFLRQRTQASAGETQLFEGIRAVEAIQERNRFKFQEDIKARKHPRKTIKRKQRKPKPEPEL